MNEKRVIVGILLILTSLFLVFPKSYLEFFNWGNSVLTVIFALIPLILIVYGILYYKKVLSDRIEKSYPEDEERDQDKFEENSVGDFYMGEEWSTEENWQDDGTDIWQGKVENNHFKMKNNVNDAHYAKKMKFLKIKDLEIDVDIPDRNNIDVFLEVGYTENENKVGKLDFENIEEKKKVEIEDGVNRLKLDLDYKDIAFFKVVLHREDKDIESPAVREINLEAERMRSPEVKKEEVVDKGEEVSGKTEVEDNEMPAFEDVEYKDLECPECEDKFKTDIGLKVHRKVNHPDEFEKNPDPYEDE